MEIVLVPLEPETAEGWPYQLKDAVDEQAYTETGHQPLDTQYLGKDEGRHAVVDSGGESVERAHDAYPRIRNHEREYDQRYAGEYQTANEVAPLRDQVQVAERRAADATDQVEGGHGTEQVSSPGLTEPQVLRVRWQVDDEDRHRYRDGAAR